MRDEWGSCELYINIFKARIYREKGNAMKFI
jgi:hypothetical protein